MAKFCTNCGRKLEEGEVCNCEEVKTVNEPQKGKVEKQTNTPSITINLPNASAISNSDAGKKIGEILKGIFVKPIDTIKEYTKEENFSVALIFVLISSIFTGLFTMAYVKNTFIVTGSQLYASLYNTFSPNNNMVTEIPYAKYFFTALVISVAIAFIFAGALYVINKAFKGKGSFKQAFALYGIISALAAVITLVATIFMFVSVTVGLIILVLGSLLVLVYLYHGLKFIGPDDQNKFGYIYILTYTVVSLIVYVLMQLFSK